MSEPLGCLGLQALFRVGLAILGTPFAFVIEGLRGALRGILWLLDGLLRWVQAEHPATAGATVRILTFDVLAVAFYLAVYWYACG